MKNKIIDFTPYVRKDGRLQCAICGRRRSPRAGVGTIFRERYVCEDCLAYISGIDLDMKSDHEGSAAC